MFYNLFGEHLGLALFIKDVLGSRGRVDESKIERSILKGHAVINLSGINITKVVVSNTQIYQ